MALPTSDTPQNRRRYEALGAAILAQFSGRIVQLDCGPRLGVNAWWASPPTAQEAAALQALIDGWDWVEQAAEQMERRSGIPKVQAALLVRASSHWAGLPAPRKAQIMAVIDEAAQRAINALTADPEPLPVP